MELIEKTVGNYNILPKTLGSGAFGICKQAQNILNQEQFAVKIISKIRFKQDPHFVENVSRINSEIEILKTLDSPYVMKIQDIIQTDNNIYLFLEFCNGGNLAAYRDNKIVQESQVIKFLKQIKEAYQELYKKKIIHRDLKPENILLHNGDIKIGDFGFAKLLEDMNALAAMTALGTPYYSAIEILKRGKYSSKCDIFSIGIIIYQLLFGTHPYLNLSQLTQQSFVEQIINIYKNSKLIFPLQPKIQNPYLLDLLNGMLQIYENDRIG